MIPSAPSSYVIPWFTRRKSTRRRLAPQGLTPIQKAEYIIQNVGTKRNRKEGSFLRSPLTGVNYMYGYEKKMVLRNIFKLAKWTGQTELQMAEMMQPTIFHISQANYNRQHNVAPNPLFGSVIPTDESIDARLDAFVERLLDSLKPIFDVANGFLTYWLPYGLTFLVLFLSFSLKTALWSTGLGFALTEILGFVSGGTVCGLSIVGYAAFGTMLFGGPAYKLWDPFSPLYYGRAFALFSAVTTVIRDPPQLSKAGNGEIIAHTLHWTGLGLGYLATWMAYWF